LSELIKRHEQRLKALERARAWRQCRSRPVILLSAYPPATLRSVQKGCARVGFARRPQIWSLIEPRSRVLCRLARSSLVMQRAKPSGAALLKSSLTASPTDREARAVCGFRGRMACVQGAPRMRAGCQLAHLLSTVPALLVLAALA